MTRATVAADPTAADPEDDMGTYVAIRGWIECDAAQLALIREIIDADPDIYNGGWAFPARPMNCSGIAFYGSSIRAGSTGWFLDQLRRIAALPATDPDDDYDDRACGLFIATHEEDGQQQWQVRDGRVVVTAGDPAHAYLDI